jgi:cytochrome b561
MRMMHHILSLLIIIMLIVGLYMADLPKEDSNKMTLYMLHKTFGWFILWLVTFRFIMRLKCKPHFAALPKPFQSLANIGHYMLYALMFIMPISGWLMSSAAGYNIVLFGIESLTIPNLIAKDKALLDIFKETHEIAAWLLMIFIGIHILAALIHKYVHKINVLSRMFP